MVEASPPSPENGNNYDRSYAPYDDDQSSLDSYEQTGVKNIEAISQTWTRWSLVSAYLGIFLLAFFTSLEGQTTTNLTVYATSAFSNHSLVATVLVVQGVVNAVIKPPMAKIANAFGRLEAFSISVFLYVIGYIQMAASNNVKTFAAAQIFYSAGNTGLQILQQIFVADTSDLLNRALWSSLPDIPFLITVWAGAPIADNLLSHTTWRWGYGIWTIVLPIAFLPLALALLLNMRKARKLCQLPPSPWKGQSFIGGSKSVWYELDIMGLLLLSAAFSLILIPCTLAQRAKGGWNNGSMIAMVVVGCVCLVVFPLWESSGKLAPRPFLSLRLFKNRTVVAGCAIGFFYFGKLPIESRRSSSILTREAVFYTSVQPYFYSYLQVVQNDSVTAAGHITQTFTFTSTVSSIIIGLLIKYTHHYKYFITAGAAIYLLGTGLMIRYRTEASSTAQIVGTQIALGIGGGMVNVPAQLGVQASASHGEVAAATAVFLTVVEIGGAVGSAISGAVWNENVPRKLALYLPLDAQADATSIFGNLTLAQSYPIGSSERIAINRSYQETMNILLIIAVCLSVPLLPLSVIMSNYKLNQMDQKVKGNVIGQSQRQESTTSGDVTKADADVVRGDHK
ncbi:MAG: hypothetical protein LQ343_005403 [Gyalolechia ehrenbergii]|nr:MAG: hypothetical protein LQ343_005403 [Gyalolechia ehrenbergii]